VLFFYLKIVLEGWRTACIIYERKPREARVPPWSLLLSAWNAASKFQSEMNEGQRVACAVLGARSSTPTCTYKRHTRNPFLLCLPTSKCLPTQAKVHLQSCDRDTRSVIGPRTRHRCRRPPPDAMFMVVPQVIMKNFIICATEQLHNAQSACLLIRIRNG